MYQYEEAQGKLDQIGATPMALGKLLKVKGLNSRWSEQTVADKVYAAAEAYLAAEDGVGSISKSQAEPVYTREPDGSHNEHVVAYLSELATERYERRDYGYMPGNDSPASVARDEAELKRLASNRPLHLCGYAAAEEDETEAEQTAAISVPPVLHDAHVWAYETRHCHQAGQQTSPAGPANQAGYTNTKEMTLYRPDRGQKQTYPKLVCRRPAQGEYSLEDFFVSGSGERLHRVMVRDWPGYSILYMSSTPDENWQPPPSPRQEQMWCGHCGQTVAVPHQCPNDDSYREEDEEDGCDLNWTPGPDPGQPDGSDPEEGDPLGGDNDGDGLDDCWDSHMESAPLRLAWRHSSHEPEAREAG